MCMYHLAMSLRVVKMVKMGHLFRELWEIGAVKKGNFFRPWVHKNGGFRGRRHEIMRHFLTKRQLIKWSDPPYFELFLDHHCCTLRYCRPKAADQVEQTGRKSEISWSTVSLIGGDSLLTALVHRRNLKCACIPKYDGISLQKCAYIESTKLSKTRKPRLARNRFPPS